MTSYKHIVDSRFNLLNCNKLGYASLGSSNPFAERYSEGFFDLLVGFCKCRFIDTRTDLFINIAEFSMMEPWQTVKIYVGNICKMFTAKNEVLFSLHRWHWWCIRCFSSFSVRLTVILSLTPNYNLSSFFLLFLWNFLLFITFTLCSVVLLCNWY